MNIFKQKTFDYEEAFSRNEGLLTKSEQERLRSAQVAIPGLGGVGGAHLLTLARMGVGRFHIADHDQFTLANFNRQYGATLPHLGKNKTEVMGGMAHDINPEIQFKIWNEFIDETNVVDFLSDCDLVLDGIDAFEIEARRIVFMKARQMGIPVITAGPIGFSSVLLVFMPDSISFEDYFDIRKEMNSEEKFLRFMLGLAPKLHYLSYMNTRKVDPTQKSGPSVASSVALCAGFAATEAVKILLKRKKISAVPHFHYFDPYLAKYKRGFLPFGNRNPIQRLKLFFIRKFILKKENPA